MNTSKLDDILEDVFMVGVQHESRTVPEIDKLLAKARDAIVEAVEGLIGEDEPTAAYSQPGMYEINEHNKANAVRNKLRAELRQAIKEWQK